MSLHLHSKQFIPQTTSPVPLIICMPTPIIQVGKQGLERLRDFSQGRPCMSVIGQSDPRRHTMVHPLGEGVNGSAVVSFLFL